MTLYSRLCWLFVLALLCLRAYAEPPSWQLTLMIYSSASGHGLPADSYLARFRLPATDAKDCDRLGKLAMTYYIGGVLADGSRALPAYTCEAMP